MMQDTQVKERPEIQSKQTAAQTTRASSSFDHAEYERWSQNLRNRMSSKK